MIEHYHEECGVLGIYRNRRAEDAPPITQQVCQALSALQHRGQEAAGIAVNEDRLIRYHKGLGLISEVFSPQEVAALGDGDIAVGHVRYSTSGNNTVINAQPMVVRHVKGQLALCHNGNLTNSYELRRSLELSGCIFQTTSDTEVISYLITRARLRTPSIEDALSAAMEELSGAYSLVMTSPAKLLACRDPHGLRPLCYGKTEDGAYVFASESCALDAIGAVLIRELEPGEILVADADGLRSIRTHCGKKTPALCLFEYIYFARPDSIIDGLCVHEARRSAGVCLAQEAPQEADVVIGVPDSGLDAALGYAEASGIPYGIGLVKNKYIGRSFIAPDQEHRRDLVRRKLNVIAPAVRDRRLILIDDSIVRGTTSAHIVHMLRQAGAREIHMRICAPPFLHPCYYGTDIDSAHSLIAAGHTPAQIAEMIGADTLAFLSVESARRSVGAHRDSVCAACFDGHYPAGIPRHEKKDRFEAH